MEVEEMLEKDVAELAGLIKKLEIEIFNIEMKSRVGDDCYDGDFIFQLLEKAGVRKIMFV